MNRSFEIFGESKEVSLQYIGNTAIEAFDHAIGLRVACRIHAVPDALLGKGTIKDARTGGALFELKTAIQNFRTIVGQPLLNAEGCDMIKVLWPR